MARRDVAETHPNSTIHALIGGNRRGIGGNRRFHSCWVTELPYAAFFGGAEKAPAAFIAAIFASS